MSENNQSEKSEEIVHLIHPWRIFTIKAFLFCLTLGLGIITAIQIKKIFKNQKIVPPEISFWEFILYFFFLTLFILFIVRFIKFKKEKEIILKTLFVFAVFLGGLLLLEAWFSQPFPLIIILLLIFWWWKFPSILNQDILVILGIAGVGSFLGLVLKPEMVILFLIIFSIYDFIAVYKTKHMIKIAREMIESGAILGLIIPPRIRNFKEELKEVKVGGRFLVLGGGDIVFPLLFAVSLIPYGILNSLIVAIFSLFGLFVSFYFFISQKIRQPIPALPPIALFSIIGYLVTRLIE